ncbi:winged helix-turn-helix domain-containing protein [Pantoea ananatis]|uniref:winged helix-turn-helix domain-containing protein n=1 Tax=Pantoea ananas TaxID=553 RepID=UPI000E25CDE5|nr:winged helix-turn-helix domain-containing protein [Pantoea ananatis]MCV3297862.1 winged helix-turn-helix domain-containing protein [Pantoea ananatis]MDI6536118.1 winged helix-turn-helix domain-containing protein [Pantoea ananatis]REE70152.1 two-component system response regulator PhoP [Pantoea ananatis]BBL30717.1 transcriptional regulatory protein WalR [Pantoea ananatis]
MRVLIVEKEQSCGHELASRLSCQGMVADIAYEGNDVVRLIKKNPPDLFLFRCHQLTEQHCALIARYRKRGIDVPVLIAAAESTKALRIKVLGAGADDFIDDDTDTEELAARMHAIVRRGQGKASSLIQLPPYELDTFSRQLMKNGTDVALTCFEYIIIETLMKNAGKIVTKERLMHQLYADADYRNQDVINVLVCRLNKKLSIEPDNQIRSVRRLGYTFQQPA